MNDSIWVAYVDYDDEIACEQLEVKSRTAKQLTLKKSCKGTRYRTRLRPDFGYATKREALDALLVNQIDIKNSLIESIDDYKKRIEELQEMINKEVACPTT